MAETGERLVKMEVDYSDTANKKIPECEQLANDGKLPEALENLLSLEKQTRTASDTHSTGRILVTVVKLCFQHKQWDLLNENIVLLTKKRSQLKLAVQKMVQEACLYVDQTPNMEEKLKLINTLRTVTAGKIYVEIEKARLTLKLAKIKEEQGDISEAANVLQELQVETFGSMEKKEKVEFILEQMRLCLAKKDYIRTQIISKKVSTKIFDSDDETLQELKLKFYHLMISLDQYENSYIDVCKHYRAIYDTPIIKKDKEKWQEVLKCVILYIVLSPYDNEQSDLIHRIYSDKNLEEIPVYRNLLKSFNTTEIMRWQQVNSIYGHQLRCGTKENAATQVFSDTTEGNKRWKDLHDRVVEHNIRIMSKYYTQISLRRMGELLELSESETEEFLSDLVVKKTVYAKVDRLAGIVGFAKPKDPNEVLNEWSTNITQLMKLVNQTTHLINKEEMVHQFNQ